MKIIRWTVPWLFALLFTAAIAVYQRRSGPTNPIEGTACIAGTVFDYRLERTHSGEGDQPVRVVISDPRVRGWMVWKRFRLDEPLRIVPLERTGDTLEAFLPHQPPAGKLEYRVILQCGQEEISLPFGKSAVTRFKGAVPAWALVPHILLMFAGLITAVRAAWAAVFGGKVRAYAWVTLALITFGGLMFGPIVQEFAFGSFWTGLPFGGDLTDNKTAVMVLVWLIAVWRLKGVKDRRGKRWYAVAAMVVTFAVYLIPHSMHGSEFDYRKLPPDSLKTSTATADPGMTASPDSPPLSLTWGNQPFILLMLYYDPRCACTVFSSKGAL